MTRISLTLVLLPAGTQRTLRTSGPGREPPTATGIKQTDHTRLRTASVLCTYDDGPPAGFWTPAPPGLRGRSGGGTVRRCPVGGGTGRGAEGVWRDRWTS
ncbi:hypothetical protein GCM10027610_059040 [Dactylosporangium cerinum]